MDRKIIPLQHKTASRILETEWSQQLLSLEHGLNFFEEYFLWSTQQISELEKNGVVSDCPESTQFFHTEAPLILEESREALRIMKLLFQQ